MEGHCGYVSVYYHYSIGRALFASGALLGLAGIATNNEGFQRVGGAAAAGGLGLKAAANIFGGR